MLIYTCWILLFLQLNLQPTQIKVLKSYKKPFNIRSRNVTTEGCKSISKYIITYSNIKKILETTTDILSTAKKLKKIILWLMWIYVKLVGKVNLIC